MIREYLRRAYQAVLPLLFARSKFELFLATSLGNLDLQRQQLASLYRLFIECHSARPHPCAARVY